MVFKSTDWGNFLVPFGGKQNFSLDDSFTVQLQKDIQGLTDFQTAINNGNVSLEEAKKCLKECSQGAIIYSDRIANGTGNVDDFRQQSIMAQVALNAQNKSLGNCAALIGEYNTAIGTSNNMTANAGVSQQSFATAVSQSNPALGTYLSNLNGSKASLGGYVISLIAAKASTIALQVATMALNTALTMGISFAISTLISAIRDWIDENHTSKEELEEIIDTFQRQRSEVNKNAKELDELIPKYEKLSKGVNSLGENVSLTSDEYEEYHEVTNKIADFVPSLVQGFDEQGNAILSCKDNVDELTEAYNNLIRSQNSAVLAEGKSVFKDFTKQRKDFEKSNYQNIKMTVYANEALRNILKSNNFDEAIRQYAPAGTTQFVQIVNALKDAGLEQNTLELGEDFIKRSIQENKVIVESIVDNYDSQIKEAIEGMETVTSAYISNAFIGTYKNISPGLQTLITSITSSFGYDFYAQFDKVSDLYSYLDKLMSDFNKLDKDSQEKLALVFDLETQYNNKEISLEEYQAGIKAAKEVYEKLDTETQKNFALIFDFDTVLTETENVKELTDEQKAKIANAFKQSAGLDEDLEVSVDTTIKCDKVDYTPAQKEIYDYYKQIESEISDWNIDVSQAEFGNIDLNNRQILNWTNENLEKYKKEWISWESSLQNWATMSESEQQTAWNNFKKEMEGGYSTVFGGAKEYKGIDIAYSPMLQTEEGAVLLSRSTVDKYINAILESAGDDISTENILNLDTKGLEIDGKKIKNIIADIGDSAIKTSYAMHYLGEDGAFAEAFNDVKKAAKEAGKSVDEFLGLFELSPEQSFNELTEWFNNLSESDQSLVYDISVQTDNTQYWNLIKWQKELDLIKESGMSSAESLQIFNEMMSNTKDDGFPKYIKTYRENIEALNDALFKLNSGEELSKSDRLTLLEKFPSLSGAINSTSALKSAISNLIKETNLGLDDKFAEAIKEVGGVATESGKALLEYQSLLKTTKDTTFDFDIEKETEKFSAMYSAISESVSGTGVSQKSIDTLKEMFSGLGGYKTADLFEKTAHGIHLNAEELRKLQKEYENTKKKEFADQIENLKQKYNDCTAAIDGLVEGSDLYNQKVAERDAILTEIENVEMLSAQYDGLTSAYNKWIKAKSAGNERDMYENMLSEVDTVQDLIDRGWAGSEEVRNYIELLGGKDLTTATVNEIIAEWDRLNEHIGNSGFTAFDFFTKDEDGKTVSDGIYNFFNTVRTVMGEEFAKLNGDGTWTFNFTNTKDIAEQLGLGVEYVETILRAASDAGFNINFNVQNTKAIDEANEKIEKTEATVKELKAEPIKVDVDTEDAVTEINRVKAEIDKVQSNGEITAEVKAAITEDADAKLDLIAEKKVQLEQPTFMTISVDVLEDESLSDTLELLHNYQTAVNDVDKLKLLGESDDKVAEAQKKVDEYAKQISELSPEIKAKIGIDEKATVDDIKKKIEKNEIKIKTKLDIDEDLSFEEAIKRIEKSISGLSGSFAEELKKSLSDVLSDKDIKINADVSGISLVEKLYNAINELQGKTVSVKAKVAGGNLVDKLYSAIERLESKVVDVSASVNGTQDVNNLRNAIQELTDKTVTVTTILNEISGSGQVDGTAHANGTAYANGNWGAKDSGVALGGELGREIVVRDGKWFTVGDNGAEFFNYKKNDIIFNADQATQLLENGKITHGKKRGKSFAEGTAFYGGTGASGGGGYTRKVKTTESEAETTTPTVDTNPSGSGFYDTPSSSNTSGDSEKFIDRVAIKLNRLQREISKISSAVSNIFTLWSDRGKSLTSEIGKVTEEIHAQEAAAERYLEEAHRQIDKYGLDMDWVKSIEDGSISFAYLTNLDDLYEGYQTYQQWYEKYLECRDSVADLKKDLSQLYKDNFDNIQKDFENQLALNQSVKDENEKDFTATTDYFSEMRKIESKNLDILNDELSGLESSLEKAVNSGAIQEGSEAWQEMKVAIDDVNRSISETNVELAKLYQEHFSYIQEGYENQIESYKSLRNENEKTYKKDTNYFSEMRDIQHKNIAALENELEDLETVYDEAMDSGRIEMYSDAWYEMRKGIDDTQRAISDANVELAKLYQDNFNYIEQNYQNQLSLYEHYSNIYSSKSTLLQTQGYMASSKLIERQMAIQNKNVEITKRQISDLTKELNEAMDSGRIEQYSDAWYNMQASIDAARESLYKTNNEIANLQNSMRQLDWDKFDLQQEMYSQLNDEADFLINLMSFTDLYDKKGNLTDTGIATMGLHNFNVTVSKDSIEEYQKQIDEVDRQLAEKPYDLDLLKHRQELIKLQRESITSMENEQKAMVSLVENGIKAELSSLKELIDAYSDALDAQKDLYDYQSQVADKSKDIATIQKQLSAYANDNSEEARATVQKLKVDLSDAKKDLSETEYEKSIAEQKKLLNSLYDEYEKFLNNRLDDTKTLLEDMKNVVNSLPMKIGETLSTAAASVGVPLSQSMSDTWGIAAQNIEEWNKTHAADQQITEEVILKANDSWGNFGADIRDSAISAYYTGEGEIITATSRRAEGIEGVLGAKSQETIANSDSNKDHIENTITDNFNGKDISERVTTTNKILGDINNTVSDIEEAAKKEAAFYFGDVDMDGSVTAADSLLVLRASVGLEDLTDVQKELADVNGDGKIDSSDSLEILRRSVGLSPNVKSYSTGGLADYTGIANIHGTKDKPELVLNANDTQNFMSLRDTLRNIAAKQDLSIIGSGYNVAPSTFAGLAKVSTFASGMSSPNVTQNTTVNLGGIAIDHVESYNDLISQMQKDKNFEKLVRAMTIDQMTGKGSLTKYEHRW